MNVIFLSTVLLFYYTTAVLSSTVMATTDTPPLSSVQRLSQHHHLNYYCQSDPLPQSIDCNGSTFVGFRGGGSDDDGTRNDTSNNSRRSSRWQRSIWKLLRKKKTNQRRPKYETILEDQIVWLEQQIRQVSDQKAVFKRRIRTSDFQNDEWQSQLHKELQRQQQMKNKAQLVKETQEIAADRESLSQTVQELDERIQTLNRIKIDLQDRLKEFQSKLDVLQEQYDEDETFRAELESSFQNQIKELEQRLADLQKTDLQLPGFEGSQLAERIEKAVRQAVEQFWMEDAKRRLEELEYSIQQQHDEELSAHRRQTQATIQKQRQKMRALVKSMAIRERKLYKLEQEQLQQQTMQKRQKEEEKKAVSLASVNQQEAREDTTTRSKREEKETASVRRESIKQKLLETDGHDGDDAPKSILQVVRKRVHGVFFRSKSNNHNSHDKGQSKSTHHTSSTTTKTNSPLMFSPLR